MQSTYIIFVKTPMIYFTIIVQVGFFTKVFSSILLKWEGIHLKLFEEIIGYDQIMNEFCVVVRVSS